VYQLGEEKSEGRCSFISQEMVTVALFLPQSPLRICHLSTQHLRISARLRLANPQLLPDTHCSQLIYPYPPNIQHSNLLGEC
jgi:hypothetical protein